MCLSSARATGGVKAAVSRAPRMRTAGGPEARLRSRRRASPDPLPCARPALADGDISLPEDMALVDIVMRQILAETALRPAQAHAAGPKSMAFAHYKMLLGG